MRSILTCVMGSNNLFREGLKSLLAGTEYEVVASCERLAELDCESNDALAALQLFLFGVDAAINDDLGALPELRALCPESRIVVVTTRSSRPQFQNCLTAGVDGYLVADVARAVLVESLRLVMQGVQIFPSMLMRGLLAAPESANPPSDRAFQDDDWKTRLSPREQEILALLIEGATNKKIAGKLHIEEATVKVHLRRILKRTHAANRTQVAVWAASRGFNVEVRETTTPSALKALGTTSS